MALKTIGAPHIRRRPGGFEALFRIIIEQQVSVPSAQAIWTRCQDGVRVSDPRAVLKKGEEGLRAFGLSRPKARYVFGLAMMIEDGSLDLDGLPALGDEEAAETLQLIKGIGPWTAAIYLLFCEGRIDVWPPKDVALKAAYSEAAGEAVSQDNLDAIAQDWAPHRGLAAHILWTYYAELRGRTPI